MKMPTCLSCDGTLESPLGSVKLSDLLGVTLEWLYYKGVKNLGEIKSTVLKMMRNYSELSDVVTSDFGKCRHCLMDSVFLFVPKSLKSDFKRTFIDVYR